MDSFSLANAKTALRSRLQQARKERFETTKDVPSDNDDLEAAMRSVCLSSGAKTVAAYLSYGFEPETRGFIHWALQDGIRVLLPISRPDGELEWVDYRGDTTTDSLFGFEEAEGAPADLADADVIFMPALAVDAHGHRLGKGKGYYDRSLARLGSSIPRIAVIFDEEFLDELPAEDHDEPVDAVVTATRLHWFNR